MRTAILRVSTAVLVLLACLAAQSAWAALPAPNQPILVVQNAGSTDPYQNFVPELLTAEGLNGFQTAQLADLNATFLANYDVVILPHFVLTSAQATLFQNYVNAGGVLVGFRPDLQLAPVFGVAPRGATLSEGWLQIDTTTPYALSLVRDVMKFHGAADLYSLSGAAAIATLYDTPSAPTASPAVAVNSFGSGTAILFSFDLTQSIVLMRQGNPDWAGYPNNHDGFNTMRASGMFMDKNSGQFWNDLGDGALRDVPQADIQLRLLSNLITITTAARRPLPRLWYFPNRNRAILLMTGDDHGFPVDQALAEFNSIASFGGKFAYNLWYPFNTVSTSQVSTWLAAGNTMAIHFNDTAETDSSGVGGSAASWNGMQNVITTALSAFQATYPAAPFPLTTRDHFLIWVSNNAAGDPDQTAQAKLFQNNGIQLDTSYTAFPNRWGYMTGSGLPMKFLDTKTGAVIPVYEQATQYEDDIQLQNLTYSLGWNPTTASSHYIKSLSDSLTKYNTVITMLFHPENWPNDQSSITPALQYAQSNSIPMLDAGSWLNFWKARAATALSMPSFVSNTLTFTATGSPAGLTLLVPDAAGANRVVSAFLVDGAPQAFTVAVYQGVAYASVVLAAGSHNISVSYTAAGRISGQISPSAAVPGAIVQAQSGSLIESVSPAPNGSYAIGPLPAGSYQVSVSSAGYTFSSQNVTLGSADLTNINFTGALSGETLFTTQTPVLINQTDGPGVNYEMGTAFTADVDGQITGIRFWKAPSETAGHVGKIWSSTGQLLASVTFTNETASGWQQQNLSVPFSITANTTYVVSVNTANAYYVATNGGLAVQINNFNLHSVLGANGLYGPPGAFPTNSAQANNYFRDVVFLPANQAPPPPANILIDVTTSTDRSNKAATVVTPAFSTTAPNELLLAFISADSVTTPNTTVTGVTGAGLTWALVNRTNVQSGTSEIWRAFAPAVLNNVTVTATLSQSVAASITVMSFTGVDTTGTSGSGAIGAIGSANARTGAPSASLVTTRANSLVLGVGNDWDNANARTVGPAQSLVHQYLATVGDTFWVQRQTNATAVSGTTVTINDTAPAGDRFNLSIVEVLASLSGGRTAASITPAAGTPQSTTVNSAFGTALQVLVRDSNNQPIAGALVSFTAPPSGATASFAGSLTATATTNASGIATAPTLTANGVAGSYVVTASTSGLAALASFNLTNNLVAPASIVASAGTPQSATINTPFAAAFKALVKDASNNPISGITVTFTAPATGASGTFAGGVNTAITDSTGTATAPVFTANSIAGSYTVAATVSGLATPANFSLTNTPGAPASITATAGNGQSAPINTAFATALQATVKDSGGNVLSGVSVTFAAPASGASGTFSGSPAVTTNSSGVATAPVFTANSTVGSYTVTATAAGLATPASFTLTNTAGAPASITATAGTPQNAIAGAVLATPLQATVKDSLGNLVSGAIVTFTAPASGPSGTFAGSLTATATTVAGVATAPAFTANTTLGSYTVTASVAGVSTPASFSLTNTLGAPASITATAGSGQSATVGTAFATALQATVKDAGGNLLSGISVTFAVPASGASGSFSGSATVTTDAAGVATAPALTANTIAGTFAVTASVSGVSTPASFNLTNNAGPAASITATAGTPQSTVVGTAFPLAMKATVKDSFGNLVNGVTVTFTAPATGASGTFAGSLTATATTSGGVATAPTFTANTTLGSYTVSATVSGVATSADFSLTNSPVGPIAIDANRSTDRSSKSATIASPAFSTTATNELLLAFISADYGSGTNTTVTGVTGAGLTWTLVQRTNAQSGTAEIWRAFAPATLNNVTVTATLSQSVAASMTILSFTGVNTTGSGGSGAIGAIGSGNARSGAPAASLITTKDNSWVIGVGTDWDNAIARTPGAGQTIVHQYLATIGDTYWVQRVTALSPAGTLVTLNDTAPATDRYNLAICEIVGP